MQPGAAERQRFSGAPATAAGVGRPVAERTHPRPVRGGSNGLGDRAEGFMFRLEQDKTFIIMECKFIYNFSATRNAPGRRPACPMLRRSSRILHRVRDLKALQDDFASSLRNAFTVNIRWGRGRCQGPDGHRPPLPHAGPAGPDSCPPTSLVPRPIQACSATRRAACPPQGRVGADSLAARAARLSCCGKGGRLSARHASAGFSRV